MFSRAAWREGRPRGIPGMGDLHWRRRTPSAYLELAWGAAAPASVARGAETLARVPWGRDGITRPVMDTSAGKHGTMAWAERAGAPNRYIPPSGHGAQRCQAQCAPGSLLGGARAPRPALLRATAQRAIRPVRQVLCVAGEGPWGPSVGLPRSSGCTMLSRFAGLRGLSTPAVRPVRSCVERLVRHLRTRRMSVQTPGLCGRAEAQVPTCVHMAHCS